MKPWSPLPCGISQAWGDGRSMGGPQILIPGVEPNDGRGWTKGVDPGDMMEGCTKEISTWFLIFPTALKD